MQYKEYGKQNKDVVILLHGGGLSWWNYREIGELLENQFHVILPILDGHSGSDNKFTTIKDNASEIINFIDEQYNGKVLLIGGLSLGGQILLEILAQREDICQFAMVESAAVIPSKLTYSLIEPAFGNSYGLIKQRWFAKLQFKSLKMKEELFEDYYRDTCLISKEDMIAFMKENSIYTIKDSLKNNLAEIHLFVGSKEIKSILSSAKTLHDELKNSTLHILPGLYHGQFSINNPKQYVDVMLEMIKKK